MKKKLYEVENRIRPNDELFPKTFTVYCTFIERILSEHSALIGISSVVLFLGAFVSGMILGAEVSPWFLLLWLVSVAAGWLIIITIRKEDNCQYKAVKQIEELEIYKTAVKIQEKKAEEEEHKRKIEEAKRIVSIYDALDSEMSEDEKIDKITNLL